MSRACVKTLVAVGLLAVGGCAAPGGPAVGRSEASSPRPDGSAASTDADPPAVRGDLIVLAAASLTESFTELGEMFEAANPGVTVIFNFGASSTLAQQIASGAPVDVFAAASPSTMSVVTDDGLGAGAATIFARNRLQIAVPAGNPAGVRGLADFADKDLTIALCAPEVPCGSATVRAFELAGVTPAPDTLEQDVKATLTKVELGEVDAGLVYRTDVIAAGDLVEGIDFSESAEVINDYLIIGLAAATNAGGAHAFVDFALSAAGQRVLSAAGFEAR